MSESITGVVGTADNDTIVPMVSSVLSDNIKYAMNDPFLKYSWYPESESLYMRHSHEILFSFLFYLSIHYYVAPWLNKMIFGKAYTNIDNIKTKSDFDIHTVSMFQAIISLIIIYPVFYIPTTVSPIDFQNDWISFAAAISIGYFIWDLFVCLTNFKLYGFEFLAHAIGSLLVISITLKPFVQVWGPKFLIFEASTPFVNVNWYISQMLRMGYTVPTWINIVNGLCLMSVFFFVRLIWGFLAIGLLLKELYKARADLPLGITAVVIILNLGFNILNVFWFSKMLKIVKKMAGGSKKTKPSSKQE